jgi:A1 cistron-splicing factor AAR2
MDTSNNAVALLLDLTPSALGGIDLLSFTTTPRFKGIRSLPAGWHFVFTSTNDSVSVRHGAWFYVSGSCGPPELFVFKWDAQNDTLVIESNAAEILRWRANLGSVWRESLTPYRQRASKQSDGEAEEEASGDWARLTDAITPQMLDRVLGSGARNWKLTTGSSAAVDVDEIAGLPEAGTSTSEVPIEKDLHFLPIDLSHPWPSGAMGRERTEAARDHSWYLNDVVQKHCHGKNETELVGEMQFAFLMVLCLSNYSCLEQWKRILSLLFTCKSVVATRSELFVKAIQTLQLQLRHSKAADGGGLFDLSEDGAGFLRSLLKKFKIGLRELADSTIKTDVQDELEDLESFLKQELGWDLSEVLLKRGMIDLEDGEKVELELVNGGADEEDESGEYAPQIVDLSPEQMRLLNMEDVPSISFKRVGKAAVAVEISPEQMKVLLGDDAHMHEPTREEFEEAERMEIEYQYRDDGEDEDDLDQRF